MTVRSKYALLGDIPILEGNRNDLLKFDSCAQVLGNAAMETPDSITIGIFGKWGTGKTSMMRLIKSKVEANDTAVAVWFNAWQYEKEEHLIVPLTATITRAIDEQLKQGKWVESLKSGAAKVRDALRSIAYGFEIKGKIGIPLVSEAEINLSAQDMIERYQDLTKDSVLARSLYFDAFERLEKCAHAGNDSPRIVVFIDDLDRCFPDKAVALLEGIKLVLNQPGFSFVLGIHDVIIREFLKKKYSKECGIDGVHFEDYLDKIIQVKVPVPERDPDNMAGYIRTLLTEANVVDQKDIPHLVSLLAESANRNPRSIVRLVNRIIVAIRINELDKLENEKLEKIDPTALILDMATDNVKYQHFKGILDDVFQIEENRDNKQSQVVAFGKLLADIIENSRQDSRQLWEIIGGVTVRSRSVDLEKVSEMLHGNPHIVSILKTKAGLKWLKDKEYRRGLKQAGSQTIGEQKKEKASTGSAIEQLVNNMVEIPAGTFSMGDSEDGPIHKVTLSPFKMGAMQVTQRQYEEIMKSNPSNFKGDPDRPVENVSWEDAIKFCEKLSQLKQVKCQLPTEAQWEYACRAGSESKYCFGDDNEKLQDYAWFAENSGHTTQPVGKKNPNAFGLYDMHGNVWEWCSDRYGDYKNDDVSDPTGPESGSRRVLRGGSWRDGARGCRCAYRFCYRPGYRSVIIGFRVVFLP
ncbi:MAG TPA: SUMF1/EgtB/PvdO family nonheme iron enzyme [Chitinispirillaceae bacterium]|nr:SUMF1/EgtB/PvdO family nonheme iron enzyme [Chitinispirillaceae bacterium]